MNQQNLIANKLRIVSQLADSLSLSTDSYAVRNGLRVIADTTLDASIEVRQLDPEELDLSEVLARVDRSTHPLARS